MKKIIIAVFASLILIVSFAQKVEQSDVPEVVINIFKTKITDSVVVTWTKTEDVYFAEFTKSNMNAKMQIRETGEWLLTDWTIPPDVLPSRIKDHMIANYDGFKTKLCMIEYRQDGEFYIIDVKKKKDTYTLTYRINCEFVKADKLIPVSKSKG